MHRVVTIDGPAGSGKSTVARRLAEEIGFRYVDTGAMYRAVAVKVIDAGIPESDDERIGEAAETARLRFEGDRVFIDDRDVTEDIRSLKISTILSTVAANFRVRAAMKDLQRRTALDSDIVMEGRDIGSAVFPEADVKFFLEADAAERARRRCRQLGLNTSPGNPEFEEVRQDITNRDKADTEREHAPLVRPPDAVLVDTSGMDISEVVDFLVKCVREQI